MQLTHHHSAVVFFNSLFLLRSVVSCHVGFVNKSHTSPTINCGLHWECSNRRQPHSSGLPIQVMASDYHGTFHCQESVVLRLIQSALWLTRLIFLPLSPLHPSSCPLCPCLSPVTGVLQEAAGAVASAASDSAAAATATAGWEASSKRGELHQVHTHSAQVHSEVHEYT